MSGGKSLGDCREGTVRRSGRGNVQRNKGKTDWERYCYPARLHGQAALRDLPMPPVLAAWLK